MHFENEIEISLQANELKLNTNNAVSKSLKLRFIGENFFFLREMKNWMKYFFGDLNSQG